MLKVCLHMQHHFIPNRLRFMDKGNLSWREIVFLTFGVITSFMCLVVDGACIALNPVRYLHTVRWMIKTKTVTVDFDATINHQGA